MSRKKGRGKVVINRERCKGCCLCMSVCPNEGIAISNRLNQHGYYPVEPSDDGSNGAGCTACALCAVMCPDLAIEVYRD